MSLRPLLLTVGGALVLAAGACTLNTAGLGSTSGGSAAGAGGAPGATTAATGSEQAGQTSATTQSSVGIGAGGAGASSGSTAASSGVSTAVSSVSAAVSGSASSSSGGVVTCDSQFQTATAYQLCKEGSQGCEFNVTLGGEFCGDVCAKLGGECTATFDNGTACEYLPPGNPKSCQTMYGTAICQCALRCGINPPCAAGETCNNGTCIH